MVGARNANLLIGEKMQIEIYGVIAKWGSVDVVLALFNNYNEGEELLNQYGEIFGPVNLTVNRLISISTL